MAKITSKKRNHFWKKFLREKGDKLYFASHAEERSIERFNSFWLNFSIPEKLEIVKKSKVYAYNDYLNIKTFETRDENYNIQFVICDLPGKAIIKTVKFLDAEPDDTEDYDYKIDNKTKLVGNKRIKRPRYRT